MTKSAATAVTVVRSTAKAHLVQAADGRQGWVQNRSLKADSSVTAVTFDKAAAEFIGRMQEKAAATEFAQAFHAVVVVRETEKAVAIEAEIELTSVERDISRLVWLPKSQLCKDGDVVSAPGWILSAKRAELLSTMRGYGAYVQGFGGVACLAGL